MQPPCERPLPAFEDRQLAAAILALMIVVATLAFCAGYLAHMEHTRPEPPARAAQL